MRMSFDEVVKANPQYAEEFAVLRPLVISGEEFGLDAISGISPLNSTIAIHRLIAAGLLKQSYGYKVGNKMMAGRWETPLVVPGSFDPEDNGELLVFMTPQGEYKSPPKPNPLRNST